MPPERLVPTPLGDARLVVRRAKRPVATLVMTHGAGGGIDSPDLVRLARTLPQQEVSVTLVEMPWRVQGKKLAPRPEAATVLHVLHAHIHQDFKEPFGFRDGISQPIIRFTKRDADFSGADRELHVVEPGEFILGYENGHGRMPLSPSVLPERDPNNRLRALESYPRLDRRLLRTDLRDFGRNGTYVVLRQLEQDVEGFGAFLQAKAGPEPRDQRQLAAKIVGRWHDGAPLATTPHEDPDGKPDNEFSYYANDRYGHRCPLGAHIRRGNPRDTFSGEHGRETSLKRVNLHRVLRRGRIYGPPYPPPDAHDDDRFAPSADQVEGRGIMFLVMNTDLRRQFEFVQQTWMNSDTFTGVSHEADPLVGARCRAFTIQQAEGNVRVDGLRRFVTVRGGAYFFMPGLAALRCLADPIPA